MIHSYKMAENPSQVCEVCLYKDPKNVKLLSFKCLQPTEHRYSRRVPVQFSRQHRMLVELEIEANPIRPLPRLKLEGNKRFILCKHAGGSCFRGDNCTFAHSKAEQEAWNNQLQENESSTKIGHFITFAQPKTSFSLQQSHFPVLGANSRTSQPHSAPLSPSTGGFSFAQAARKQTRNHSSSSMREPQQFPTLRNSHAPPFNAAGRVPYQRSTSAGQFRPILQPSQVKGHPSSTSQSRSLSDSSAGPHHVGHHGVTGPQHPHRHEFSQHPNMAAQNQAMPQAPLPSLPHRQRDHELERQEQASRLYGRSTSEHAQQYEEAGAHHPGVTPRPPPVTYPVQPMAPYHGSGVYPQMTTPPHYLPPPNMPVQFPFSPGGMPQAHHINPSPFPPPPQFVNAQPQVDDWPQMGPPTTPPAPPQPRPHYPAPIPNPAPPSRVSVPPSSSGAGRETTGPQGPVHAPLSRQNYKPKFTSLLDLEEKEHKRVLDEKCNGRYMLVLYQYGAKPPAMRRPPEGTRYRRYGYLDRISGDQVAYATQASQGSINILNLNHVNVCKADILRDNYHHIEEKLYIAFDLQEDQKMQGGFREASIRGKVVLPVFVRFVLKHTYFRNLRSCVDRISPPVIKKIVPSPSTFGVQPNTDIFDLTPYKSLCSPDQLEALTAILTCPSEGPPNVIVGPFGTGKTRILAIAASCFFSIARNHGQPARVLVCTQQRESVDNFYEHFQNLMGKKEADLEVIILRDYGYKHADIEEKNVYKTVQSFVSYTKFLNTQQNHLIMSTCMMVRELIRELGTGWFSHILIDEGAQMREPEAIAPLSLANPDKTKIVIAGDQHQLVLPCWCLGTFHSAVVWALLSWRDSTIVQRLRQEAYISTLVTNYRSHPDIVELPSSLFYETPLIAPQDCGPPPLHPKYPYPLVFLCSSVDQDVCQVDDNINEVEAGILIDEAGSKFARHWPTSLWGPPDLSQTCIMSSTRPQLTIASQLIYEKRLSSKLKAMRRLPTYDMQGREFRALFLSTSEPTNSDASTKNPTKSLCDRHIFNTAITRAQSLVVAAGNPFLLLKTEQTMLERYGKKGKVWSNYLKRCLEHKSFVFPDSLKLKPSKKAAVLARLKELVAERVADPESEGGSQEESTEVYSDDEFPPLPSSSQPPAQSVVEAKPHPLSPSTVPQAASQPPSQPSQNDGFHGYLPQQSAAGQPQVSANGSTGVPQTSNPSLEQWLLPNVENLFSVPPPATEESQDLFQRFPALFASPSEGTAINQQSSASSLQPSTAYVQQPMGTAYQGYPAQPLIVGQDPVQPRIPQSQSTDPQPHAPQHVSTDPQPHAPQHVSTDPQPHAPQHVSTDPQPHAPQHVSTGQGPAPPGTIPLVSAPSQNRHGSSNFLFEVGSPLTDNVFSPIEQNHRLPDSAHHPSKATQPRKRSSHSGTDAEVQKMVDVYQTSSSAAWSGGEMRVSPEPKDPQEESGSSQRVDPRMFSDDTFRKTPSPPPVSPTKKGRATASDATPTIKTRLEKEFEVKEQIGKGGFGVVYHVKSRLDQYEYALKLIRLSNVSKEQDKVMREVRALARLEHPHIVRYHTSWKERAPDGWTEKRVWSMLKSSESLPSAMVPAALGDDSTHTTPRATAPSSAHTNVAANDLSVGIIDELTTDSVVTFRASPPIGASSHIPPQVDRDFRNDGRHPPLLNLTPPPTCLFIQTELCERDTLRVWLLKNCEEKRREKRVVLEYFQQILKALVYIHREQFVHRDLKPSNIFFSRREQRLKIGDFGLVTTGVAVPHGGGDTAVVGSGDSHSRGSVQAGTYLYMSPEQIRGDKYDEKSDMFALGLIFFELHYCMKTDTQKYHALTSLRRLELPPHFIERLPSEVSSIIKSLLAEDPSRRPSAADLKAQKSLKNLEKKVRKSKKVHIPVF